MKLPISLDENQAAYLEKHLGHKPTSDDIKRLIGLALPEFPASKSHGGSRPGAGRKASDSVSSLNEDGTEKSFAKYAGEVQSAMFKDAHKAAMKIENPIDRVRFYIHEVWGKFKVKQLANKLQVPQATVRIVAKELCDYSGGWWYKRVTTEATYEEKLKALYDVDPINYD